MNNRKRTKASNKVTAFFIMLLLALFMTGSVVSADDAALKPYVLAYSGAGTITARLPEVKAALSQQGFQVVGEYAPYKGAHVVVVTSEALKDKASKTEFGAYGAIERVSLTETAGGLQISFANPLYYSQAYRMQGSFGDVAASLEKALGKKSEFGSKDGLSSGKLRKYHYMMMMPYFTDQVELASHSSFDAAVKTIEANLAAKKGGSSKVYRVDIPGKKAAVFGIGISEGDGSDTTVMKTTDFGELKHTAHLPYELVVVDGKVFMLHGKFRIAVDFPDLTMGTFMKITSAPSAIQEKLELIAGGK